MGRIRWAIALAVLLACSAAIAGCASSPQPGATATAAPATTDALAPTVEHTAANVTTDRLHLLEPPLLGLRIANHTVLTPKGATYQAQTFFWNTTFRHDAIVTGADFDVFLRITGSQAQAGSQDPGCSAVATLVFTLNGTARAVNGGCGSVGVGVVAPGDRELRFAAPPDAFATSIRIYPHDEVQVQLTLYLDNPGFAPTCYIMGGPDFDSAVRLAGLNETYTPTA